MPDRERTNSITHLVKIVAREVFHEELDQLKENLEVNMTDLQEVTQEFCSGVRISVDRAGSPWKDEEDEILLAEIKTAIAQIAKNHQRSMGAIRSRINQKELI